jgi:hypothetical protein
MRWGVVFLIAAMLGGCATKYQDMGFTGGVSAEPVMTDVYRILARGNGYTSADRVQDFVLLRPRRPRSRQELTTSLSSIRRIGQM